MRDSKNLGRGHLALSKPQFADLVDLVLRIKSTR